MIILGKLQRRYRRWKLDRYFEHNSKGPIYDLGNGDRIQLYKDEISYKLYTQNEFENNNRSLWDRVLQTGMTVFDVGANCGLYSLSASRRVGTAGKVFAFEPNPRERDKLMNNLSLCEQLDRGSVSIQVEALGEYTGETQFFIPDTFKGAYGSIRRPDIQENCQEINVPITTIDIFVTEQNITSMDMIKIDVEGNELNVLKGAQATLKTHQPIVLMEVSDRRTKVYNYRARELCDLLLDKGYELFVSQKRNMDGKPVIIPYVPPEYISYVDVFAVPPRFSMADLMDNGVMIKDAS